MVAVTVAFCRNIEGVAVVVPGIAVLWYYWWPFVVSGIVVVVSIRCTWCCRHSERIFYLYKGEGKKLEMRLIVVIVVVEVVITWKGNCHLSHKITKKSWASFALSYCNHDPSH